MAFLQHKNNAVSSISTPGGINNSATSVSIQSGDISLFPASGNFEITLWPANTNPTAANSEIVLVTSGQGTNTFTITRAQEGTTAKNFNQGDNVGLLMTAKQLTDIESILSGGAQGSILYFNNLGQATQLSPGTSGQVLETQGANQNPIWANQSSANSPWISDPNTWTYVSAQSFTITGNFTNIYVKGTKLQWTDSGGVKYGIVQSSSFSNPTTTVTIVTNNDYSIANSAITLNSYSYVLNPPGYPGWFNWTPTWSGYSVSPTLFIARFTVIGNTVYFQIRCNANGTSNANTNSLTMPTPITTEWVGGITGYGVDNNAFLSTSLGATYVPSGSQLQLSKDLTQSYTSWTTSGQKSANLQGFYEW